jgi:hypothetical protein
MTFSSQKYVAAVRHDDFSIFDCRHDVDVDVVNCLAASSTHSCAVDADGSNEGTG